MQPFDTLPVSERAQFQARYDKFMADIHNLKELLLITSNDYFTRYIGGNELPLKVYRAYPYDANNDITFASDGGFQFTRKLSLFQSRKLTADGALDIIFWASLPQDVARRLGSMGVPHLVEELMLHLVDLVPEDARAAFNHSPESHSLA